MKKSLNHTDMQSLEVVELENVSGGFGRTIGPRGPGTGFPQGIVLPEDPGRVGGIGGLDGGFPLGTPSQDFEIPDASSDLIG